jgi:hypothetical protein
MESNKKPLEDLLDSIENISNTQIDLLKLKSIKTASILGSSLISSIFVFMAITSSIIFSSIALALYVGDLLNNHIWGFLILAGFYLFIGVVFSITLTRQLKKSISKYLINKILNQ